MKIIFAGGQKIDKKEVVKTLLDGRRRSLENEASKHFRMDSEWGQYKPIDRQARQGRLEKRHNSVVTRPTYDHNQS
jgi:hypothetical protein